MFLIKFTLFHCTLHNLMWLLSCSNVPSSPLWCPAPYVTHPLSCDMSVSKVAIFCHVKAKTAYITCCTALSWDISPHPHSHPHLSPNDIIFHPLTDCSPLSLPKFYPDLPHIPLFHQAKILTQTCSTSQTSILELSWVGMD